MSCTTAEDLDHDTWVQILQRVDLKQRLSACALVCKKLAGVCKKLAGLAAAAPPPGELDLQFEDSPQRLDAFLTCWASAHGSSLTRLHLSTGPTGCCASSHSNPIRQLPCPNLLELKLVDCRVQLCASSEGLGLLHTCTALTALILYDPILLDGGVDAPAGAVPAAAVARLQHLELTQPQAAGPEGQGSGAEAPLDILLPHLTSLTCLSFWTYYTRSCFLQHISTLVGLQKLFLGSAELTTATLPGIVRLTAQQDLSLRHCSLKPSCLWKVSTGLTRLAVEEVTLEPFVANRDAGLGATHLLWVLNRVTGLRKLELSTITGAWPQRLAAHSALTASSSLQELWMEGCEMEGAAMWAHVFPAGRELPHLRTFTCYNLAADDDEQHLYALSPASLARYSSCCPGLQQLNFIAPVDASFAPLRSLTALTGVCLYLEALQPAAVRSLSALTLLQSLELEVAAGGSGQDATTCRLQHLVPLTSLTGLTRLNAGMGMDRDLEFINKAAAGSAPDVWVQLLEHCNRAGVV